MTTVKKKNRGLNLSAVKFEDALQALAKTPPPNSSKMKKAAKRKK
jgi:hypothetical protein